MVTKRAATAKHLSSHFTPQSINKSEFHCSRSYFVSLVQFFNTLISLFFLLPFDRYLSLRYSYDCFLDWILLFHYSISGPSISSFTHHVRLANRPWNSATPYPLHFTNLSRFNQLAMYLVFWERPNDTTIWWLQPPLTKTAENLNLGYKDDKIMWPLLQPKHYTPKPKQKLLSPKYISLTKFHHDHDKILR